MASRSADDSARAPAATRLVHIDWLRGVAVLIMILWHAIDAWTLESSRGTPAFRVILIAAGWAAPLFLFLAGVSVALAADARVNRGSTRADAARALMRRGWQVFLLAHLFRLQSFLLNPNASWSGLFKPDILNVLGLSIVVAAYCWGRGRSFRSSAVWLVGSAVVAVAVLTPWSREWWWPTLLHPRAEAYLRPVGNFGVFTLFPFIGFVLVGAFVGELIARHRHAPDAFYRRIALAGGAFVAVGGGLSAIPALAVPSPIDSAPFFLWRTGAMTLALSLSWALVRRLPARRFSPLVVFGQTSLFVYWVHVELAYGVFSYPIRRALPLAWSFPAYLVLTAVMLAAAVAWQRRPRGPMIPAHMRAPARS
jgi:uncharacterized membrane protein